MAWYPGTEGGTALADVLFGDVSPSGKLPVTYPRAMGQLPLYYNRLPSGRPTLPNNRYTLNYLDEDVTPALPVRLGPQLHALRLFGRGDLGKQIACAGQMRWKLPSL